MNIFQERLIKVKITYDKAHNWTRTLDEFLHDADTEEIEPTLFEHDEVGDLNITDVLNLGFRWSGMYSQLGKNVEEFSVFVQSVNERKSAFLWYSHEDDVEGTMYFDGLYFYYSVFDYGVHSLDVKVPYDNMHLSDLKDILRKMKEYEKNPIYTNNEKRKRYGWREYLESNSESVI